MVVLTQRHPKERQPHNGGHQPVPLILALTAEARGRSRHRHLLPNGEPAYLQLPRGTCLQHGDLLTSAGGEARVQVVAKPEPVMTVQAPTALALLKAAYHLGNRHVPLEVTEQWLRLSPDPVLKSLLIDQLQMTVIEEVAPFQPEVGAYHSHPEHSYAS
ncbi:MAG: urease accessory protein UreE [Cyanobacteria bacterium P01_A01_bin.105]